MNNNLFALNLKKRERDNPLNILKLNNKMITLGGSILLILPTAVFSILSATTAMLVLTSPTIVMASLSASAFNSLAVSLNYFSKSNIFILFTRV